MTRHFALMLGIIICHMQLRKSEPKRMICTFSITRPSNFIQCDRLSHSIQFHTKQHLVCKIVYLLISTYYFIAAEFVSLLVMKHLMMISSWVHKVYLDSAFSREINCDSSPDVYGWCDVRNLVASRLECFIGNEHSKSRFCTGLSCPKGKCACASVCKKWCLQRCE